MVKVFRRRYIAFRIVSENEPISKRDFINNLRDTFSKAEKDLYREANLWLVRFERNKGILRCNHKAKDRAIKALGSMRFFNQHKEQPSIKVEATGTSGTIKKCNEKFYSKI
jgi:RNase P/RNase MRP subunit POP5